MFIDETLRNMWLPRDMSMIDVLLDYAARGRAYSTNTTTIDIFIDSTQGGRLR